MEIGEVFSNKYKVLDVLGKGGFSIVYLAKDLNLNKHWAIKEIPKANIRKQDRDILHEANLMKELNHPAFPRILEIAEDEDTLYIVMDYIEGETLSKVINTHGSQPKETVSQIGIAIAQALSYLHDQNPPILFKDLKPGNVMITPEGYVKIIDFGVARKKEVDTKDKTKVGTAGYASPEHFTGETDERSDIYSIGMTLYYCLTGIPPSSKGFEMMPPAESGSGIYRIIERATSESKTERQKDLKTLIKELEDHEKYSDRAKKNIDRTLTKVKISLILGLILILASLGFFILGVVYENSTYEGLIHTKTLDVNTKLEKLKKAIYLNPQRPEAYELILKHYAKEGFKERQVEDFLKIYTENESKLKRNEKTSSEINYLIGEGMLLYYEGKSDKSVRNKLLTASEYFKEVTVGEHFKISRGYANLGEYYENFILAKGGLMTDKGANKEDYKKALESTRIIINEAKGVKSKELKRVTYQISLNFIDMEKLDMLKRGVSQKDLVEILDLIKKNLDEQKDEKSVSIKEESIALKTQISQIGGKIEKERGL